MDSGGILEPGIKKVTEQYGENWFFFFLWKGILGQFSKINISVLEQLLKIIFSPPVLSSYYVTDTICLLLTPGKNVHYHVAIFTLHHSNRHLLGSNPIAQLHHQLMLNKFCCWITDINNLPNHIRNTVKEMATGLTLTLTVPYLVHLSLKP